MKMKRCAIHKAAGKGDVAEVTRLLRKDPALARSLDDLGNTPLHLAGTVEVARLLVDYGADVNAPGCREWRPLHTAAQNANRSVARFLIESNAEVDAETDLGETPLSCAGSAAVAQLLIDHGASLKAKYSNVFTPLMRAALDNHKEVVELLLRHGATINASVPCVGTALTQALQSGSLDIAAMLIEAGADVNLAIDENNGYTPLHWLMLCGNAAWTESRVVKETRTPVQITQMLLMRGADLRVRNHSGETPYHVARRAKAADLIAELEPYMALLDDPFPSLPGPPYSERICIHPSRQEAVTTVRYGGLALWSLEGEPRLLARVQTTHSQLLHIDVSPDGEEIAIADGNIVEFRRWHDLSMLSQVVLEEAASVDPIAFAPNGRWLTVGVYDKNIHLIERQAGNAITQMQDAQALRWLGFDASSRFLACDVTSETGCVSVYRLAENAAKAELLWTDAEEEFEEEDADEDKNKNWQSLFLVHAAISPDSRWLVYFGAQEYSLPDCLGELVCYALQTGKLQWHVPLEVTAIGEERLRLRDFYDDRNRAEVLFISNTELVCGARHGALPFYDVNTGKLNRCAYLDTEADVLSLALDRVSATLWAVLSDGKLASLPLTA